MSNKILVTYASRAGSTAEVAEAIGRTLAEGGAQVDVRAMNDVKDLSSYRAVVAGSAIRASRWLPEATQFIKTHQAILTRKPFAMFTVCITMAMKNAENYRAGVAGWVAPVRALVKPLDEGFFAGMLDFSKLPLNWDTLMLRLTVAVGIFPRGDHRDWNAINNWAKGLRSVLGA
ncbi:MAG TPA: flavodoxin domain-containing protein [Anaerolineales bacterium]|nr:flavodoxin domain-containing protein [Anaerolineales bacterium]